MKHRTTRNLQLTTVCLCLLVSSPWQATAQSQLDKERRGPDPIVDIDKPQPDQTLGEIRAKRSKRHNLPGGRPLAEPHSQDVEEGIVSDFQEGLPALPVAQSDAIVTGSVTRATAHLSEDRAMVYSEFSVALTDILKTTGNISLRIGQSVEVERLGGAVRFPSGRVWHFRIYQQGFPKVGGTYVLFLKYNAQTQDFHLVTGYEVKSGIIAPLDGVGFNSNPKLKLASSKYNGADATTFFADLRTAINGGMPQ